MTNKTCGLIVITTMIGFIVSLSLDLHGLIAIITSLTCIFFTSALIGAKYKVLRIIKRIAGCIFMAGSIGYIYNPNQNIYFVVTLLVAGILMTFDKLTMWATEMNN